MSQGKYSQDYKDKLFYQWYNAGKPSTAAFMLMIDATSNGHMPGKAILQIWIGEWRERSIELDERAVKELDAKTVQSKVEMFERHAGIGREMQKISMEWLRENKTSLTPGTAVRMLVDGVEMEQSTAGLPDAIRKMLTMTDEDLKNEIAELLTSGHIEPLDADN